MVRFFSLRPCSVYSMVDESSDELKLSPTRKKNWTFCVFSFFPPTLIQDIFILFPPTYSREVLLIFPFRNNKKMMIYSRKKAPRRLNKIQTHIPNKRNKHIHIYNRPKHCWTICCCCSLIFLFFIRHAGIEECFCPDGIRQATFNF